MVIEFISWFDSYGVSPSWVNVDSCKTEPVICYSSGFILKEDEFYIVICGHWAPKNEIIENEEVACGEMAIPKCSIIKREVLKVI